MPLQFTVSYVEDSLSLFRYYKKVAEGAMEQVTDEQLFAALDGEKPDRNRDSEFVDPPGSRDELMALWNRGWPCVFSAIEPLSDADLSRTITIRRESHSVMQAINRQIAHYAYHCGQIVFLAKHFRGGEWKSLSVPRGGSAGFNKTVGTGEASQR